MNKVLFHIWHQIKINQQLLEFRITSMTQHPSKWSDHIIDVRVQSRCVQSLKTICTTIQAVVTLAPNYRKKSFELLEFAYQIMYSASLEKMSSILVFFSYFLLFDKTMMTSSNIFIFIFIHNETDIKDSK